MKVTLERLPRTIALERGEGGLQVAMVDQRRLPYELAYLRTANWREVVDAVKTLAVRGAPAIGVAGAVAVALAACELAGAGAGVDAGESASGGCLTASCDATSPAMASESESIDNLLVRKDAQSDASLFTRRLDAIADEVAAARPTAVNLSWGTERARAAAHAALQKGLSPAQTAETLFDLTERMIVEDEAANRAIGAHGAELLRGIAQRKAARLAGAAEGAPTRRRPDGEAVGAAPLNILTHCNAGSLATAFFGTALGVVYAAAEQGLIERVYADETRPVGQGARLTVWELSRAGVPVTLACDNMAASLMAAGSIDAVIVGADRIAANGDVANKIGTLGVAVLARHFGVPFFVAAPESTIDEACATGADIAIEPRDAREVLAPPIEGVQVYNPAFDVTPAPLVTAIITEHGIRR